MKKSFIILIVALAVFSVLAQPARSYKRGVSENGFSYEAEIRALEPGVCWFYNWGNTPNWQITNIVGPGNPMEFCPMIWSASFNETNLRAYLDAHPGVKYLLGYNEPNFRAQANMTPDSAARLWPIVEKIASDYNLQLVAPALNYTGETLADGKVYQPEQWMDAFLAAYPEAHFDYLALHCYMNDHKAQRSYVENFAKKYGKQVWLTEFCAWEGTVDSTYQKRSMVRKLQDLEQSPYVYRYSWFKAKGNASAPWYRLLINPNIRTGLPEPGTLSGAGIIYTYFSSFDTTYYYRPNERIAAKDFIDCAESVYVEENNDTESDLPLQISSFDVYSHASYLIDVPRNGDYTLQLRISSRKYLFDPKIRVEIDGVELVEKVLPSTITSGTDDKWKTQEITLPGLTAGKHTLTIKSRQSTTCKINWLLLVPPVTSEPNFDINGDGIIDVTDVNIIIDMVLGKTEALTIADFNNDGNVDVSDVNMLIDAVLGK